MYKLGIFLILFFNSAAFGQHYFNNTVDIVGIGGVEVFRGIAHNVSEDKFYLIGTSSGFEFNNNPLVIKFNESGETLDTMWIDNSSEGLYFAPGYNNYSIIDAEDNIIFVGAFGFPENARATAIIFKINALGDTLWTREFGNESSFDAFSSIRFTNDSNYVMAGYSTRFGSFTQAWLVKMAPDGTILWQQNYGGFGGEFAYSVDTTADGGYILAGFTDTYGAGERDIYVIKTDAFGNMEWEKWFGGPGDEAAKAKQLQDGTFLVYGSKKILHPDFGWLDARHAYVLNLDATGNIIWAKDYANYDSTSILYYANSENIFDCEIVSDGFVYCGYSVDSTINNPVGWVFKTDFQGNVIWNRRYQIRTNDHYLWDMLELPGGDLLFGGFVFPTGGGVDSQDGWIMRTNCLGFESPPVLDASMSLNSETQTVTITNSSLRFGDGSINWGDGNITYFTEHDSMLQSHTYTQNGDYTILFKINACYHHDSLAFNITISGIPGPPITPFTFYPNPTTGQLTINYNPTGEALDAGVQIIDMAGRLVFTLDLPNFFVSTTLNLSTLSTGTYLLRFFTANGDEIVEKLVVY